MFGIKTEISPHPDLWLDSNDWTRLRASSLMPLHSENLFPSTWQDLRSASGRLASIPLTRLCESSFSASFFLQDPPVKFQRLAPTSTGENRFLSATGQFSEAVSNNLS